MFRRIILLILPLLSAVALQAQVTLEECVAMARANYPLIRKYDLLSRTRAVNLDEISKGWLPRINVYAQGTVQNDTPSFPSTLAGLISQTGTQVEGLDEWQYKIGADISQDIWDGGQKAAQRKQEMADNEQQRASLDVKLYAVRQRVEGLYFAVLLIEEQAKQTRNMQALLRANLEKMQAMVKRGTAMQADADMLEAQLLTTEQQLTQAISASLSYRKVLSLFTGKNIEREEFTKPTATIPQDLTPDRPEIKHFEAQLLANSARQAGIKAGTMPRIGLFAQSWYGYPGLNYFESMMNRHLSFNILAGVKISWDINSFFTEKNKINRVKVLADNIAAERETFLFDTSLQTSSQLGDIEKIKAVMKNDERIVELRSRVRQAAESQLSNGVIDATALLTKLTDENQARLTAAYHEIQLLQAISKLKTTLNR